MSTDAGATVEVEHTIAADLRAFEGHFPGAPVLPGAYLLALVLHTVRRHTALARRAGAAPTVQQVKFLAPVGPGQTLHIRVDDRATGLDFTIRCGATPVARGHIAAPNTASSPTARAP